MLYNHFYHLRFYEKNFQISIYLVYGFLFDVINSVQIHAAVKQNGSKIKHKSEIDNNG